MSTPLGGLDPREFIATCWQRRPCLIRGAIPGFAPELDADDVAGLACDELAEARLVTGSYPRHDWTVRYGPFTVSELRGLPPSNWTLLVQDVEKHYPPLQRLLARFDFLPSWRLDDLMVSVAAPGGSVGPHVDRYDVFLLQAAGRRRWQISEHFAPTTLADVELNVLQDFTAEAEWVLEPGDMLYLPPGVAHHGVALDPAGGQKAGAKDLCMTWSIGLRAPSAADLLQALGEALAESPAGAPQYRDPQPMPQPRPGEVDRGAIEGMRELMRQALQPGAAFDQFIGQFLSQYRLAHPPAPPGRRISPERLLKRLAAGATLSRNPWTRVAWISSGAETEGAARARLFAAGEEFAMPERLAIALASSPASVTAEDLADPGPAALVCTLVNRGHFSLAD